jgi:hypothetical protein
VIAPERVHVRWLGLRSPSWTGHHENVRRRDVATVLLVALIAACSSTSDPARHVDDAVGLSYVVPEGWRGPFTEDLLYFSTAFSTEDLGVDTESPPGDPIGLLGSGSFEGLFSDPGDDGLAVAARQTAIGMAEFFIPASGERDTLLDEQFDATGVDGWRVAYRIVPDSGDIDEATVEFVVLATDPPAYLVGIVTGDDPSLQSDIQAAIESVEPAA